MKRVVVALLGIVLVFILAAAYFFYGLQPSFANDNPVEFRVAKGARRLSIR